MHEFYFHTLLPGEDASSKTSDAIVVLLQALEEIPVRTNSQGFADDAKFGSSRF